MIRVAITILNPIPALVFMPRLTLKARYLLQRKQFDIVDKCVFCYGFVSLLTNYRHL